MVTESVFGNQCPHLFSGFKHILTFNHGDDVDSFFAKAEQFLSRGCWLCGYFSYEFGYFLEGALAHLRESSSFPLAWLGVCREAQPIAPASLNGRGQRRFAVKNIKANISEQEYCSQIKKIKYFLEEGQTYQVNFTFKNEFDFQGNVFDFYASLRRAQFTALGAVINTGEEVILSFSPELFFRMERGRILSRPMKGTVARGRTFGQDQANRRWLSRSLKIKAENVMIVDLVRNDLGRVSSGVRVPKLFEIEKYRTLYQMTSTVQARLKKDTKIKDIFLSLFPCGSVTGAPKIRTMQIIKSLEAQSRGVYTGAIGYISPNRDACFNVAIRTVCLRGGKAELGIGGGIVYDSVEENEFNEAILKSKFLVEEFPVFFLIESILWEKGQGYFLRDLHLRRLQNSCEYFGVPLDSRELDRKLQKLEKVLNRALAEKWKVRILVSMDAKISIEHKVLGQQSAVVKVAVSSKRINADNKFLYHKTTNRCIYDEELSKARREGFFEVMFLNNRGELTEGAISNIFVEKKGTLYTPALKSGLLPGVLREHLLANKEVQETTLYPQDIYEADRVYIGNSVRGLIRAVVSPLKKRVICPIEKVLYI
ncbi:MAG: aminodeoxychorismate synthase component I [Candidatus Omnitrophota bacterium]|nr:MAG: aminodeoxychorismate synthase component I [Candidatus Omnitrophota bacterium]